MRTGEMRTYRWTTDRYDRLADTGIFDHQRVELLQGRIVKMAAQKEPHAAGILLASPLLTQAFGEGYCVRNQMPIKLDRFSKPGPDLAIVPGKPRDYIISGPPTTALLIVEVADATLAYDRGSKARAYARFKVADYWILNVVDRQLEVHRQPVDDPDARYRFHYADITILKDGQSVSPLAAPASVIAVRDLLP